jgi:hypothetical protein
MIGTTFPGAQSNEAAYPAFEPVAVGDYVRLMPDSSVHKMSLAGTPEELATIIAELPEPVGQTLTEAMAGSTCRVKFLNRTDAP